jgi:Fe-S-cluster containining protein
MVLPLLLELYGTAEGGGGLYDQGFLAENSVWGLLMPEFSADYSAAECDCCGACCQTFPVLVSIGDARREPRILQEGRRLPEWQHSDEWEFQLHPLPFLEACPFLREDRRCAVYSTRPDPCRRFAAGSPECEEARARRGLRPLTMRAA